MLPRTLFCKLSLALFVLFIIVGAGFQLASLNAAHMYQQEVAQRLNRDLAMYIAEEHVRLDDGEIDTSPLTSLFHSAMIINPSLELYLLDETGNIEAHSVDPGRVQRQRVSLDAIHRFLSDTSSMPVLGDDPRNMTHQRAFSVAPIMQDGINHGYVYAVLGSEQYDYISELIQQSVIMRESSMMLALALLFSFLGGMFIFFLLTHRLYTLGAAMEHLRHGEFDRARAMLSGHGGEDEIAMIADTFDSMAEQIQSQMDKLKETDALRRELVANVSHDLRTPLATMKGYIETLMSKDSDLTPEQRALYLNIAHRGSERLSKLVNELFELAKLDAGELKLQREGFSLAELVHDVVQKFALRAEAHDLQLVINIDAHAVYVEADIGLIERVLDNLIDNAIKHTPEGGTIELQLDADGELATVIVADDGDGIAEEDIEHIFKRFYRRPGSDSETPGAGLGLAIAQRILELHGSKLAVSSIMRHGTRFDFSLPIQAG